MADTSFVDESATTLAEFLTRLKTDAEARNRTRRRAGAALAVAVLHVAFVFVLIYSEWLPGLHARRPAEAPLLWLLLPQTPGVPKLEPKHTTQKESTHETTTIYTLPVLRLPPPPPSNAITDPALALGQALACGANSYEYLTPLARANCKRQPWNFAYDQYGDIVMNTRFQRPPPEPKPSNADIMARQRIEGPSCPENVDPNAPCLDRILHGGGRQ